MHPVCATNNWCRCTHRTLRMHKGHDIAIPMIKNDVPQTEVRESCRGICLRGGLEAITHGLKPISTVQWHPKISGSIDTNRAYESLEAWALWQV